MIAVDRETGEDPDHRGYRDGEQKPHEAEQGPKARSANMTQTGWSPTDAPTSFGDRMLPSINCPRKKIPRVARTQVQSGRTERARPRQTKQPVNERHRG
jgi:hypothetical protein